MKFQSFIEILYVNGMRNISQLAQAIPNGTRHRSLETSKWKPSGPTTYSTRMEWSRVNHILRRPTGDIAKHSWLEPAKKPSEKNDRWGGQHWARKALSEPKTALKNQNSYLCFLVPLFTSENSYFWQYLLRTTFTFHTIYFLPYWSNR